MVTRVASGEGRRVVSALAGRVETPITATVATVATKAVTVRRHRQERCSPTSATNIPLRDFMDQFPRPSRKLIARTPAFCEGGHLLAAIRQKRLSER